MYKKVIVAYDGSREGRSALREGALVAHRFGAELFILAVVPETVGMRVAEGTYAGCMAQQDDTYRGLLEEAVRGLTPHLSGATSDIRSAAPGIWSPGPQIRGSALHFGGAASEIGSPASDIRSPTPVIKG